MTFFDAEKLQERKEIVTDVYTGTIPKRVPISVGMSTEICIQKAGLPLGETLWTGKGLDDAIEGVISNIHSDTFPGDSPRSPIFAEISGNRFWRMSASGFMQHPEAAFMEVEEYDDFIKNPYDFILEKLLPRIFSRQNSDAVTRALNFWMSFNALNGTRMKLGMIWGKLSAKYSFFSVGQEQQGFCLNPFDFVADLLRGFTDAMRDIKRYPEKVVEATEALLPLLVKQAEPSVITPIGSTFMPCHMPTFMRPSEFEKFFYPGFSKLIHATAEKGQTFNLFCEDDWTRYLDYLQDLPQGTRFQFEYGDPKLIKEKLGKNHVVCGVYPSGMLLTHTKEQCIDKAKEILDIFAPGGNYYFNFDKGPLTLETTNLDNYYAVVDYVAQNGTYANAGQRAFQAKREDTIQHVLKDIPAFESKYYVPAAEYAENNTYPVEGLMPIVSGQIEGLYTAMLHQIMGAL